jgi:hypothetical protein
MAEKPKFVNPFQEGVTYAEFIEALGKRSIDEYCKGELSTDEIEYLKKEINLINK